MTLQQLTSIRQWHLSHPLGHQVEQQVWDGVVAAWVSGWMGLPAGWLMNSLAVMLGCALLIPLPRLYVGWRKRLHQRGRLRCDWLGSV